MQFHLNTVNYSIMCLYMIAESMCIRKYIHTYIHLDMETFICTTYIRTYVSSSGCFFN